MAAKKTPEKVPAKKVPVQKKNRDFYGDLFNENVKPRSAAQPPPEPMRSQQAKLEEGSPTFGNLATADQEALLRWMNRGGKPGDSPAAKAVTS